MTVTDLAGGPKGLLKILLVEDDKLIADLMVRRLQKAHYQVIHTDNGQDAVQLAEMQLPDLIVMDIRLPIMDGWEATEHIKAAMNTKHIPVIALTAQASILDRRRSLAAGCDCYLPKPVQFPVLLKEIEALLKKTPHG
jgi:CheY-like chemotaxis protein